MQKIIKNESKTKTRSLRSVNTKEIAAPAMHVINTLYTEKPICFESFKAGIETCRVSLNKKYKSIFNYDIIFVCF